MTDYQPRLSRGAAFNQLLSDTPTDAPDMTQTMPRGEAIQQQVDVPDFKTLSRPARAFMSQITGGEPPTPEADQWGDPSLRALGAGANALAHPIDTASAIPGAISNVLTGGDQPYQSAGDAFNRLIVEPYNRDPGGFVVNNLMAPGMAAGKLLGPVAKEGDAYAPMFMGMGAKNADMRALDVAMLADKQGLNPNAIRQETGWSRGVDGAWRWELPDNLSAVRETQMAKLASANPSTVGKLLDHPTLFENYPQLRDVPVMLDPYNMQPNEAAIAFDFKTGDPSHISVGRLSSPEMARSVLLHELQHHIQETEGWSQGGSPLEFLTMRTDKYPNSPGFPIPPDNMAYHRLAGETEARATQLRANMDEGMRSNIDPVDTMSHDNVLNGVPIPGVPPSDQILKRDFNYGWARPEDVALYERNP